MNYYEFQSAVLRLSFEVGVNEEGKPIYQSKSYRNLKAQQPAGNIAAVANAIGSLSSFPLASIVKTETDEVMTN